MLRIIFAVAAAMAMSLAGAQPWDGPLGVQKGIPKATLGVLIELDAKTDFFSTSKGAPRPHSAFETYGYRFSPTTGLCEVVGVTPIIKSNAFGNQVRDVFEGLESALKERYGKPAHQLNFVMPGSIWTDDRDWAMALQKGERYLTTAWASKPGDPALPHNLAMISLEAKGLSSSAAVVRLFYAFDNQSECIAEAERARNKAL